MNTTPVDFLSIFSKIHIRVILRNRITLVLSSRIWFKLIALKGSYCKEFARTVSITYCHPDGLMKPQRLENVSNYKSIYEQRKNHCHHKGLMKPLKTWKSLLLKESKFLQWLTREFNNSRINHQEKYFWALKLWPAHFLPQYYFIDRKPHWSQLHCFIVLCLLMQRSPRLSMFAIWDIDKQSCIFSLALQHLGYFVEL